MCVFVVVLHAAFLPLPAAQQISQKKLKKFEKEYHTIREQQEQQEAPIERYEVETDVNSMTCAQNEHK